MCCKTLNVQAHICKVNGCFFWFCLTLPRSADHLFNSKEHEEGLADCKTPEIFDHPLTSPPFPKRGIQPFQSQNKHPIVGHLGAAASSFCLMGWVCLPGKQYLTGVHPGTRGWPGVHGQKLDSWWESITCERYGGLQVWRSHWTSTSKCLSGKIRCPYGCSYQDRALIYCKQSLTLEP